MTPCENEGRRLRRRKTPTGDGDGWIYFVQCGDDAGPIKIGHATDLRGRLDKMQIGCPYLLRLLASFFIKGGVQSAESMLHERFAAHWIRGEWFACTPELLDTAEQLKSLNQEAVDRLWVSR